MPPKVKLVATLKKEAEEASAAALGHLAKKEGQSTADTCAAVKVKVKAEAEEIRWAAALEAEAADGDGLASTAGGGASSSFSEAPPAPPMPLLSVTGLRGKRGQKGAAALPSEPFAPPSNWRDLFDAVLEARKSINAPVDTVGCHMLKDHSAPPETQRYQTLLALLLSAQTRDECTAKAMGNLIAHNGCTVEAMAATDEAKIRELISPVCFYNNKARYLKGVTAAIVEKHNGLVPREYDALVAMPGLGPKMVHIFMSTDGVITGVGVDVHVHRIAQRFRWVPSAAYPPISGEVARGAEASVAQDGADLNKTKGASADVAEDEKPSRKKGGPSSSAVATAGTTEKEASAYPPVKSPEDTRAYLESWMPFALWGKVNVALVGLGQTVCPAVSPKCSICPVSALCPNAFREGKEARVSAAGSFFPPTTKRTSGAKATEAVDEDAHPPQQKKARQEITVVNTKEPSSKGAKGPVLDMEELCGGLAMAGRGRGRGAPKVSGRKP